MQVSIESNKKKWWVLVGVSIASFLGCIDFTIVNTALPDIQTSLQPTITELQWVINIFILCLSTFMVIMGRFADIYGRRRVLYLGMVIFGFASLGAGLATNIYMLIFFRVLQGTSCAILYTATGAIVSNAFPPEEKGKAIGLLFGVNGIGLALGPVLGGFIVSALSWRWVFLINVPFILVSLLICFYNVTESFNKDESTKIDWIGLIILLIALPSLVLTITQGDTWGWNSLLTKGFFTIAAIFSVLFYFVEKSIKNPIIQFQFFTNRYFISSIIATFSLAFFYCLAFFLMPLYLHTIREQSGYMIGIMLLPTTAMVAILSPVVGRVVDKHGPKLPLSIGLMFFALSAFLQIHFSSSTDLLYILIAFVCMGIGWACVLGPSTVAALQSVPEHMGALAMGTSWTIHNVGGAIGLALGITIYRLQATNALLSILTKNNIQTGTWVNEAVVNPEHAMSILSKNTNLAPNEISTIFHQFFISGYQSSMWLLVSISLISLGFIFFGMKKKQLFLN